MDNVSRRDTLKLAAAAGATAALGATINTQATAETPQEKQDKTKGADRKVGPDPHATPNPDERHALVPVRDNLYRFEIGKGRSQHNALLLVTDEGIILTDPIQTNGAVWLRDELKKRFNKPVKYVVYSHGHFDHIGGGQVFQKDGAIVVAHENAVDSRRSWRWNSAAKRSC